MSDANKTGAMKADAAPTDRPSSRDSDVNAPHARRGDPLAEDGKHDHLDDKGSEDRQEALLDEGVEETFPASDPVSAKRIT